MKPISTDSRVKKRSYEAKSATPSLPKNNTGVGLLHIYEKY
jgi:hypothetical protein